MSDEVLLAGDGRPRWRARVARPRGLRRWTNRRLAQAEVVSPEGEQYSVQIVRNWPLERTPFGPLSDWLPQDVTLPALIAVNVYRRGRTGWAVRVVKPRTAWRAERVIWVRRRRSPADVVDLAVAVAEAIGGGARPWDEPLPLSDRIRELMGWY